jgi:hypothetical protein
VKWKERKLYRMRREDKIGKSDPAKKDVMEGRKKSSRTRGSERGSG